MSEKPVHPRPRRLVDWINPAGAKKVHSLIDKVYTRKNLEMAWGRVKANQAAEESMDKLWKFSLSNWTRIWTGYKAN